MAELDPLFLDGLANGLSGQSERQTFAPLQAGVMGAGDFKVTPGTSNRELIVAPGAGFVQGNNAGVLDQGLYRVRLDASKSSLGFEGGGVPGPAADPRLDQLVARAWDHAVDGSGLRKWRLAIIPGTPTPGATLDNRLGFTALPPNCLLLADALTRSVTNVYQAGDIRDRRPWARGAYWRTFRSSNAGGGDDYTTTSNNAADVDPTNLRARIECSGAPLRMILRSGLANLTAGASARLGLGIDGVLQGGGWLYHADQPVVGNIPGGYVFDALPAPGSHLIGPLWVAIGGTARLLARTNPPLLLELTVEEIVRQNAANA